MPARSTVRKGGRRAFRLPKPPHRALRQDRHQRLRRLQAAPRCDQLCPAQRRDHARKGRGRSRMKQFPVLIALVGASATAQAQNHPRIAAHHSRHELEQAVCVERATAAATGLGFEIHRSGELSVYVERANWPVAGLMRCGIPSFIQIITSAPNGHSAQAVELLEALKTRFFDTDAQVTISFSLPQSAVPAASSTSTSLPPAGPDVVEPTAESAADARSTPETRPAPNPDERTPETAQEFLRLAMSDGQATMNSDGNAGWDEVGYTFVFPWGSREYRSHRFDPHRVNSAAPDTKCRTMINVTAPPVSSARLTARNSSQTRSVVVHRPLTARVINVDWAKPQPLVREGAHIVITDMSGFRVRLNFATSDMAGRIEAAMRFLLEYCDRTGAGPW